MMGTGRVTVGDPVRSEDATGAWWRAEATLDPPLHGVDVVWWTVEAGAEIEPGPVADAAVLAAVAPAMVEGSDLEVVGGTVSPGLLAGLEEAQQAWHQWRGWSPIAIRAEEATAPSDDRRSSALLAYSGGVDSAFSAWRHLTGAAGPQRASIDAALFVQGFDVPLGDPSFAPARDRIAAPIEDRGVPVRCAATNIRDLHDDWQAYHGFALASLLTFAGGAQRTGIVAASDTYRSPVLGWGSNAITDPLLGSEAFSIRHDGAIDRVAKLRALAAWPDAIERLRFCWSGADHAANCGACLKCVTMAMALQVLGLPLTCFAEPPDDATIVAVVRAAPTHGFTATYNQPILDEAAAVGFDAPWIATLRARLRRARYGPALDVLATPVRRRLPPKVAARLGSGGGR